MRSIRSELRLVLMLTSGSAVAFACGLMIMVTAQTERLSAVRDLEGVADVIARNTQASLMFDMPDDATVMLASVKAKPSIVMGALRDASGDIFALYRKSGLDMKVTLPEGPQGYAFENGLLSVCRPVMMGDELVGTLCLVDDKSAMRAELKRNITILLVVMGASIVVAFFMARRLERPILNPILSLSRTARAVEANDYSVRADACRDDELGYLTKQFNAMLDGIQHRDAALRQARTDLEKRVEARTRDLARSNKELEQFAYVASHDLQEPLRKVRSFTQLFARRYSGKVDEEAQTYIDFVVDGAERMQQLIQDLLSYSRVGSGELAVAPVDLAELVADTLSMLEMTVKEADAVVTVDELPTLVVNVGLMGIVLQNLLVNAIKFGGEGAPRIHVYACRGEREWIVAVRDNGIGIEDRHKERIFEVFQRLHSRESYSGSGIGLAVCRKIVERHGGHIWVESEVNKGSTFLFSIPDCGDAPARDS